jgi:hypothetical protein
MFCHHIVMNLINYFHLDVHIVILINELHFFTLFIYVVAYAMFLGTY